MTGVKWYIVQHDYYEIVKQKADEAGETVNGYIKKAIAKRMARDGEEMERDDGV